MNAFEIRLRIHYSSILLTSVLFLAACSRPAETVKASPEAPVTVSVLQVQDEDVQRRIELVGTLEGQREVTISSEVAARVIAIGADLGDRVQKGQILVELNREEFELAVQRQRAALSQALAQLGISHESDPLPDPDETSSVRKASADLTDARLVYERASALRAKGVVAQSIVDSAEARMKVAEANYTAAVESIRNLKAQVDNLRAQLAIAEERVTDCTIRAPFAGTVASRQVEIGQYLREQSPVMSLVTTNPLKLTANIPERWFPYVAAGAAVELKVEAYPDNFPGKVARVSRAVDPQTRTFVIEAEVDNSRDRLRPGLFATAFLWTSKVDRIIRVPASAVISFYGVQKVYAVENDRIQEVVVSLGDRIGDTIEITGGLQPGTWIATSELSRIRQGSSVQPVKGEG